MQDLREFLVREHDGVALHAAGALGLGNDAPGSDPASIPIDASDGTFMWEQSSMEPGDCIIRPGGLPCRS
ncbi:MAG: hypothetical protein M0C28_31560 [Candidatus Moduliflexus flocculans]|nr:hypothetical protein [Candidatus Moduliflexus flocculans]